VVVAGLICGVLACSNWKVECSTLEVGGDAGLQVVEELSEVAVVEAFVVDDDVAVRTGSQRTIPVQVGRSRSARTRARRPR
jgi:hypothetical protein